MTSRPSWHGLLAGLSITIALGFAAVFTGISTVDTAPSTAASLALLAANEPWTAVGSAGWVVDEKDRSMYSVKNNTIKIDKRAPNKATLNLRYNIVATSGLVDMLDGWRMVVRFRDNGDKARIRVKLKSYNMPSGNSLTLMSFDSDDEDRSGNFQLGVVTDCAPNFIFNFKDNLYYLEVSIERTSKDGKPSIAGIQIGTIVCP